MTNSKNNVNVSQDMSVWKLWQNVFSKGATQDLLFYVIFLWCDVDTFPIKRGCLCYYPLNLGVLGLWLNDIMWLPRLDHKRYSFRLLLLRCFLLESSHCTMRKWKGCMWEIWPIASAETPADYQFWLPDIWVNKHSDNCSPQLLSQSSQVKLQALWGRNKLWPVCLVCVPETQNLWA